MISLPRILFVTSILVAAAGYLFVGSPGLPDQPMASRTAELAERDPSELSPAEMLARLERMTQDRPDDAEPHYFIGRFLMGQGRDRDAIRAFQSALRRDDGFVPALIGLADAFVRLSNGEVGPEAQQIYAEAYSRDASQLGAAFNVGLSFWQRGESEQARAVWSSVETSLPAGSTVQQSWQAQVAAATTTPQPNEGAVGLNSGD